MDGFREESGMNVKELGTGKRNILVVEDMEADNRMLLEILKEHYTVISVTDGQEGLRLLRKYGQQISMVILDVHMPMSGGYEFLEKLNEDAALCMIPVIVTAVPENMNDEERCLELGVADFLVKPYNSKLIRMRIQNNIRLRENACRISELEMDALTGFGNRQAYYKDIKAIEADPEKRSRPVGVIFADVNGLKTINDSSGHEAGDKLILNIAEIIEEIFPEANRYRLGGDEFVVLSFDESEVIFENRIRELEARWQSGCSAAIGSIWLDTARDLEQNVALADKEMYRDKSRYYENRMRDRRRVREINTEDLLKQVEAIAESLPGGFFIYKADEKEELISFNRELVKLFHCETEEEFRKLSGNSFKGMVHPEDLNLVESDISAQIKGENDIDCVKYRIVCKDGTEKSVLDYGRFVHTEMYGDVYYVFMNDITQEA